MGTPWYEKDDGHYIWFASGVWQIGEPDGKPLYRCKKSPPRYYTVVHENGVAFRRTNMDRPCMHTTTSDIEKCNRVHSKRGPDQGKRFLATQVKKGWVQHENSGFWLPIRNNEGERLLLRSDAPPKGTNDWEIIPWNAGEKPAPKLLVRQ